MTGLTRQPPRLGRRTDLNSDQITHVETKSAGRRDQSDLNHVNAHQDKIARSCDSTGESTPRPTTTTPRSIIRHAGPLARRCGRAPIEVHSGPCNWPAAAATAVSVGIDDRRYCSRRTEESRSIHPSLLRLVLWNDRSALVGAGTLARPRCADPFQSSDLGPPGRVDFGVLQIMRKGADSRIQCAGVANRPIAGHGVSRTFARSRSMRAVDHERDAADGLTPRRLTWSATCPRCRSPCG